LHTRAAGIRRTFDRFMRTSSASSDE